MSIFPTHDISLNRYYYSFYSYNPSEDANVIKSFTYDNTQTLVETKDISFNTKSPTEMITFLENSGTNPYAVGKSGADFRSMDLAFGGVYKKGFKETQRQALMTYLNTTYKNIHARAVQEYAVTVANSGSGNKYYLDENGPAYTVFAPTSGIYVFDQSDSTNVTHPLVIGETDGAGTGYGSGSYYSSMITEGTIGSLNGYTIVDISAGTPDLYYYCSAHSGMGGQILNFIGIAETIVTIQNNTEHSQDMYYINGSFDYLTNDLLFNAGTRYAVNVSALNGTSYVVVFGTAIENSSSIVNDTSIVNRVGDIICVLPQQTLYMFDRNIAFMTSPPPVYKNYRFTTGGTLNVSITTSSVNYYIINGGGGGGKGGDTGGESGQGGNGGSYKSGTAIFSGSYTIQVGSGIAANSNRSSRTTSGGTSSIIGTGLSISTTGATGVGGGAHITYRIPGKHGGDGNLMGNLGAGGGGGGYETDTRGGNGGTIGGGSGGGAYGPSIAGGANTGSGGGGGAMGYNSPYRDGASGGSGVVFIRLPEGKFTYSGSYQETTLEFP